MPNASAPSPRLQTLDGLRGAAALLIMIYHMVPFFGTPIPEAYLAVDFFFCLSGVVIAKAYQARLEGGLSTSGFFKIRFARFYPLYLFGTLAGILTTLAALTLGQNSSHWSWDAFLKALPFALLMLPSHFYFNALYPFNGPAWSLGFEMLVNLLYAALRPWLSRARLGLLILVSGASLIYLASQKGSLDGGGAWEDSALTAFRALYSFNLGLFIWQSRRSRLPRLNSWALMLGLCLLLCGRPPAEMRVAYDLACALFLLPLVVLLGTETDAAESRFFSFLGGISYAVYAIHGPVMVLLTISCQRAHIEPGLGSGFFVAAGIVLLASLLNQRYDPPFRRLLVNFVFFKN